MTVYTQKGYGIMVDVVLFALGFLIGLIIGSNM